MGKAIFQKGDKFAVYQYSDEKVIFFEVGERDLLNGVLLDESNCRVAGEMRGDT
jgi:hypothetical protein